MRLQQAQFEWRKKLELETQKNNPRLIINNEKQNENSSREILWRLTMLVPTQPIYASDQLSSRPLKGDVPDGAGRIGNFLTPETPTARFGATTEPNGTGHFSHNRNSRYRSSDVAVQDSSPAADFRYNNCYSGSRSRTMEILSKDRSSLVCELQFWNNDQYQNLCKISQLKILLTGKAKSTVSRMGDAGQFYDAAWSILERKFGKPNVIINA